MSLLYSIIILMGAALKLLREFLERIGLELDKQSLRSEDLKKTAASLLVLLLILILIPVGLFLIKQQQIFQPRAAGELILLGDGGCIRTNKDKQKAVDCSLVPLRLINPFFNVNAVAPTPSGGGSAPPSTSASSSPGSSASPGASSAPKNVRVTGNTDVEIQAALDSIRDSGGGVYLPAGTYRISKKIRLYSNTILFGDGPGITVLQEDQAVVTKGEPMIGNDSNRGQQNVIIRDMTLKGPGGESGKDRCCEGVRLANLNGGFIINIEVRDFTWNGIYIRYINGLGSKNIRVTGCKAINNKGAGIAVGQGENIIIDHCEASNNNFSSDPGKQDASINLEIGVEGGITSSKVLNNTVMNNENAGISLKADKSFIVSNNAVCNNISEGNGDVGIADAGGDGNIYIANTIRNNQDRNNDKIVICDQSEINKGTCDNLSKNVIENESPAATNPSCSIPTQFNIPSVPVKPSAAREMRLTRGEFGLIKEALAQGNPGSDKLLYRLAESQAGLEQAPWKEFAVVPGQAKFALDGNNFSVKDLLTTILGSFNSSVFAKDSDDVFLDNNNTGHSPSPTGSSLPHGSSPGSSGTATTSIGVQFIDTAFQLKDGSIGPKQIWVQFLHPDGTTKVGSVNFNLVEKPPQILGLSCNLDISKENLKITIDGERFGNSVGTVQSVSPVLKPEILAWNNKEITAFLKKPSIPVNEGQRFKIQLTRTDGFESGTAICAVDKSLVSLGARIFCREPGKFDASDVIVNLIYNPDPIDPGKLNKIEEKVTINADGEIANLKTKLQVGKNYALAIKAPNSLRRATTFTAQEGTTEISQPDGNPFILPIGDIAPPISPDGRINTLDRSELVRQWRILGKGNTIPTGDFNRDNRVNSIDWACMNYDFGATDDPIPVLVPQSASGTINIPGGETIITISGSPSPGGSVTPQPSPSRDTSNSARIDVAGKLFLDTNRNRIADIGESFISAGSGVVKLLQVPEDHVVGTLLTADELAGSRILAQVTNNLPGANYDISVFVDKDTSSKFSVMATANNGQLVGAIDFALGSPLTDMSTVINIPVTSPTQ